MYLDPNNPINTNIHFAAQFIKGTFPVLIVHNKYNTQSKSPQFALDVIDECKESPTVLFFNLTDPYLVEEHSCKDKVKAIFHFYSMLKKEEFSDDYSTICKDIKFNNFQYDVEQFKHLKYRCEDIFHQITKSDIKKTKLKKINQELLHSRRLKTYFEAHPDEKDKVIRTINENSIRRYRPSVGYLPSYLVHQENKENVVKTAIEEKYFIGKKRKNKGKKIEKEEEDKDKEDSNSNSEQVEDSENDIEEK